MTRRLVSSLAIPLIVLSGCGAGGDPLQSSLDSLAVSELSTRNVLGIGISVRLADGRVYEADAGNIAPTGTDPYSVTDTEQVIGSLTKLYVATMIMQLVESGELSLDDTIDAWVSVPRGDEITIRMLLSHTSGLGECSSGMSRDELGMSWTPEQLLARAVAAGPVGEPGGPYAVYANTNFLVLAIVLEQVTGESWTDNLATRVAAPLGLERTSSATIEATAARVTPGWANVEGEWIDTREVLDPSIGWGYGAMTSTNRELMIFAQAFFASQLFESESTLEAMMTFDSEVDPATLHPGEPVTRLGLAVHQFTIGDVVLEGHRGHIFGYDTAMVRDPATGAIIVVTVNTERNGAAAMTAYTIAQYLRSR